LRLWHWQQALHFRTQAKLERTYVSCDKPGLRLAVSALSDARADFHIRAVQALNDTAECEGSTAEMDAESWQL